MAPDRLKPIYTSHVNDPAIRDAVDRFVIGLAERIDHLQDAEASRDFQLVAELAQTLMAEADQAGYGTLAGTAKSLGVATSQQEPRQIRLNLLELTEIVHRVRLGHKGAV
jgi:hypothetical protein